jgi:hypothetical protein
VTVAVNPRIAEVLTGEEGARLAALEAEVGMSIDLQGDGSLAPHVLRVRASEEPGDEPVAAAAPANRRRRLSGRRGSTNGG